MNQNEIMAQLLGMNTQAPLNKDEQHENYIMQKNEATMETTSKGIINPEGARFYYIRDEHNHPYITVCISLDSSGVLSRGIAICSRNDAIDRAEGRKRAYARMQIAQAQGSSTRPIANANNSAVATMLESDTNFDYKSEYDASPTAYEQQMPEM